MSITPKKQYGDFLAWFSFHHNNLRMARVSEPKVEFEIDLCCFDRNQQSDLLDVHSSNYDPKKPIIH